jgi:amino acid adenylation domain-containing protein
MEAILKGFELSPLQKRVWTLQHSGHRLFSQVLFHITGIGDVSAMTRRLTALLDHHEIFRTSYRMAEQQLYPLQVTSERAAFRLEELDWSGETAAVRNEKLDQHFEEWRSTKMDEHLRIALIRTGCDGYSVLAKVDALSGDFGVLDNLAAVLTGGSTDGPEEVCQYAQFAEWQQQLLEEGDADAAKFWAARLENGTSWKRIPFNVIPGARETNRLPEVQRLSLPPAWKNYDGDQEILFRSAWMNLLAAYLDYPPVLTIGVTEGGRDHAAFAAINGLLTRTLPFRVAIGKQDSVAEIMEKVAAEMEEGRSWQDFFFPAPFAEKEVEPVGFEYRKWNYGRIAGTRLVPEKLFCYTEPCSLKLLVHSDGAELYYDPELLLPAEIETIANQFVSTLEGMLTGLISEGAALSRLGEGGTGVNSSVPRVFAELSESIGDRVAATFQNEQITYKQLNEQANVLAWRLIENFGVRPGDVVAFRMPRSIQLLKVMLGILKAGAIFLPIETTAPAERIKFMLSDSGAKLLVTEEVLAEVERGAGAGFDTGIRPNGETPAYLIYTSGSTGKPKGVLVPHRALLNYGRWFCSTYDIGADDSSVLFSSIAFDLGFTNLWPLLLSGGTVCLLTEGELLDTAGLARLLLERKVTMIKLTPAHFHLLIHEPVLTRSMAELSLRLVVLGGEEPRAADMALLAAAQPGIVFVNHYGPTETTIGTASKRINPGTIDDFARCPTIGVPVTGNEIFILDEQRRILPLGFTGEIAVGGAGLALGYLNNEALTREKFVPHPLDKDRLVYATGDMGRVTLKGEVQFLGRRDFQVKIRGYRVELEEIRNRLKSYPGIGDAAILYLQEGPGSGNLAAYFTTTGEVQREGLTEYLTAYLPSYMIPAYFVEVETLPLTPNGKIDRRALLALPLEKTVRAEFLAPEKEAEKQIAAIWSNLLETNRVGLGDNFFDLGGNSLKLILMLRELSKLFPGKVTLTDLFRYNTIASIVGFLGEEEKEPVAVSYEL